MSKQRLDLLLVIRNLCTSRQQAQAFIGAGEVKVNGQIIDKSGTKIDETATIELKAKPPYVSRGGEKLKHALEKFSINIKNKICLDGGISTGGFTDCLLQAGAKKVYGVDVGYGQIAWSIRQNEKVVLKERTNFRYLTPEELYGENTPAELGVMDLSFISLTKVLPTLWKLLTPPKTIILLVKPQFEVGKEKVGKKGLVRNNKYRAEAIFKVWEAAHLIGWNFQGLTSSPIKGAASGNIEYLLWLSMELNKLSPDFKFIDRFVEEHDE